MVIQNIWIKAQSQELSLSLLKKFLEAKELIFDEHDELTEVECPPETTHLTWLHGFLNCGH